MYLGLGLEGLGFDSRERPYFKIVPASINVSIAYAGVFLNLFSEFVISIAALKI
jgi:hypothetical protein